MKRPLTAAAIACSLVAIAWSARVAARPGHPNAADAQQDAPYRSPYARWDNGPARGADSFPIAVWLQDPRLAERYKRAGINLYVGLWKGPTEAQLATLASAEMPVFCAQNSVGLESENNDVIVGWLLGDEPDNAQKAGEGWGPPVTPDDVIAQYERIAEADATRPVMLNLGQGVAWDGWKGRGVRTNHPEDYAEYVHGGDIVSFDIYPAVHRDAEVAGKLEYVPRGVSRLIDWTNGEKPVWTCIEASRINNVEKKPTVAQIRAEVWMSIIHGSRGLIYFVHQFKPNFNASSLLDDAELLAGVTALNQEVTALAAVINAPEQSKLVDVKSENSDVPIAFTVRRTGKRLHIFAVAMRAGATEVTFRIRPRARSKSVTVLGEADTLPLRSGKFVDTFGPYEVHLYEIELR